MDLPDRIVTHDLVTTGPATVTCGRCGFVVTVETLEDLPDVCYPPVEPTPLLDTVWVTVDLTSLPAGAPRPSGPLAAIRGYEATDLPFDVHHGEDSHPCPERRCAGEHLWAILTGPRTHRIIYCPGKAHR